MHITLKHVGLSLLILVPSIIDLMVPLYNINKPELFGLPFFYWFQVVWLISCFGFYMGFAYSMKDEEERMKV